MRYTGNYNLKKPEGTDIVNIDDFNGNSDIIDTQLKNLNDKIFHRLNQVHWLGTVTGVNTLISTYTGIPSLIAGVAVTFKNTSANTGAATLNINGMGAKAIKKVNGEVLKAGDLVAGGLYNIVYDGTSFFLVGGGGGGGSETPFQSYKLLVKATSNGQTKFKIDLASYSEKDLIMVFQNRTFLENGDYTIAKEGSYYYVTLKEPVQDFENTALSMVIVKGEMKVTTGTIAEIPTASTTQVGLVGLTDKTGLDNGLAVTQKLFTEKSITQSEAEPTGIIDGRLWLDLGETNYENSIFENMQGEIAEVVGEVETLSNEMISLKQSVSNGKQNIATAITDKGTEATGSDSFAELASKIASISTGKKWASGETTGRYVTVNGLDFIPTTVIIYSNEYGSLGIQTNLIPLIKDKYIYSDYQLDRNVFNSTGILDGITNGFSGSLDYMVGSTSKTQWVAFE